MDDVDEKFLTLCKQGNETQLIEFYQVFPNWRPSVNTVDRAFLCRIDRDDVKMYTFFLVRYGVSNDKIIKHFQHACKSNRKQIIVFLMNKMRNYHSNGPYFLINTMYELCSDLGTFEQCISFFGIQCVTQQLQHLKIKTRKTIHAEKALLLYQKYNSPVLLQQFQSWSRHAFTTCVRELGMDVVRKWCPDYHFRKLHKMYMQQKLIIEKQLQTHLSKRVFFPPELSKIANEYVGNDINNISFKKLK